MTDVFLFLPSPFWRRVMSEGYNMRERDGVGGRKVTSQQGDREEKKE